jgi:hypothetical protein
VIVYFAATAPEARRALHYEYSSLPSLLVSYPTLYRHWEAFPKLKIRGWALDSGAYSAFHSGVVVSLVGYLECIAKLRDTAYPPTIIFALDDISDWRASVRNTEIMWQRGVEAIPCYHVGEPWDVLRGYARDYPRVALGGAARKGQTVRRRFIQECFSHIWPKRVHGLAFAPTIGNLTMAPFDSVDASSWGMEPLKWRGMEHVYKGLKQVAGLPCPVVQDSLKRAVEKGLDMQAFADNYWRKEYAELECLSHAAAA